MDIFINDLYNMFFKAGEEVGLCSIVKHKKGTNRPKRRHEAGTANKWFTENCKSLRHDYMSIKSKIRAESNDDMIKELYSVLEIKFQTYKKETRKARKLYEKEFHATLRTLKSTNSKLYWDILNNHKPVTPKTIDISLNELTDFFKELSYDRNVSESTHIVNSLSLLQSYNDENDVFNQPFTLEEITCALKKLKNNKAHGIDGIKNEFIKHCPANILSIIVDTFNVILSTGIPTEWCLGIICPIYKKKGSTDNPDNYRGITLLSAMSKLFTSCINRRLYDYVENEYVLGNEQAGFREGYSTTDHIFTLHTVIDLYINKKKRIYCAFIDYKKAFDFIDRTILWQKLIKYKINGRLFRVLYNIYKEAKSCVKLDNILSDFFSCNIGVRQGENLSPLLFALFLNDFNTCISKNFNGLQMFTANFILLQYSCAAFSAFCNSCADSANITVSSA